MDPFVAMPPAVLALIILIRGVRRLAVHFEWEWTPRTQN